MATVLTPELKNVLEKCSTLQPTFALHCSCSFINMLDYMVMTTIHRIMVNSVLSFNSLMNSLMSLVPPISDLAQMNQQIDTEELPTEDLTVEPVQEIAPPEEVKKDTMRSKKVWA